jgi:hypothetical protein
MVLQPLLPAEVGKLSDGSWPGEVVVSAEAAFTVRNPCVTIPSADTIAVRRDTFFWLSALSTINGESVFKSFRGRFHALQHVEKRSRV